MTVELCDTPRLETERLVLRAPRGTDWPVWRDFHVSDRARFIGGAGDAEAAWRAFGHVIGHWAMRGFGSFVFGLRGDDRPLGMAGPWFPEGWPETEIGWTLWSGANEGRGLAAEAARRALGFARDTLGWASAVSYIAAGNDRSVRLAERLGAARDAAAAAPRADTLVYRHWGPAA